jgi:hypothetical protein
MVYQGTVKNGVVVFDSAAIPPDGTQVRVEPVASVKADLGGNAAREPNDADVKAFWDELMTFAGQAKDLPPDLSLRHDHYRRERQKR